MKFPQTSFSRWWFQIDEHISFLSFCFVKSGKGGGCTRLKKKNEP